MTLNSIVQKVLRNIAEKHLQINDFGYGDLTNYATTKTLKYPLMWVVFNRVSYVENLMNYTFSLIFADIANENLNDTLEVQNDMIQIAADVASLLKYSDVDDLEVTNNFTLSPFSERFSDFTSGVVMDITIQTAKTLNDCAVPTADRVTT